jgi:hypothetical protein
MFNSTVSFPYTLLFIPTLYPVFAPPFEKCHTAISSKMSRKPTEANKKKDFFFRFSGRALTHRIDSVIHVFSSNIFTIADRTCKVTHEAGRLTPFPSTSVTRQSTGTLFTYHGFSRTEFQFCCLWTRVVPQGVACLHSVGFGGSWTFTVIFFNVSRGSTLFVSLYISFA